MGLGRAVALRPYPSIIAHLKGNVNPREGTVGLQYPRIWGTSRSECRYLYSTLSKLYLTLYNPNTFYPPVHRRGPLPQVPT